MTNFPTEPLPQGQASLAQSATGAAQTSPIEVLAYTFAMDLSGEPYQALSEARDLLKKVTKSGLKAPFSITLLRRLALGEWTTLDRPRPTRLESADPKESAVLLFFMTHWSVTYEDLAVTLQMTEERAQHLVHRARMEQLAAKGRVPIPKPACRRPRELLSDFHENRLISNLVIDVTDHLKTCRECASLDAAFVAQLEAPPHALLEPPTQLKGGDRARPLKVTAGGSKAKSRAGMALLALGILMGAVQLHPGLNSAASAQLERLTAFATRWKGRAERFMEDLRVIKALAVGTVEGRTEELGQTLDDYVNSDNPAPSPSPQNKPASDAVLDGRGPKTKPGNPNPQIVASPSPVQRSPKPQKP
ncbi:MAG: hypothetical protein ABI672_00325 [Vicinamibacteria bacterium]